MKRIGRRSLAGGLALALLLTGCTPAQPGPSTPTESAPTESVPAPDGQGTPPAATPPPSSPYFAQPAPHPAPELPGSGGIQHIVVIVLENKAASQILGASEAGYFNQLAAE